MLIREYLREVHLFSRRILTSIKFEGGNILINEVPQTVTYCLRAGDQLEVIFPPEKKGYYMKPEKIFLDIVYEDRDLLIINKAPGMVTIPSPHNPSGTVANGVLYYYEQRDIHNTVHVVTRLDRNTSGLVLIAKNRYIHSLLSRSMINDGIKRTYKAIVEGKFEKKEGTIVANIGRKKDSIIEREVTEKGKDAITHYEVEHETSRHSLVNIELETGRTHQIRVHFSHIGHPVAGDTLYGGSTKLINRQALHCYKISFKHPITKEVIEQQIPLPKDMHNSLFDRFI